MKKMKLKELINVRTGKLDANASSENGKYPFFTCSKETLKIDTYSYDCECVLLAGNGDLNVKYYNGKFDAYQRTYILECKNEVISTKYLYYFMKKYLKILRNQSIGGVIKYIKLANITEAIIPIYSKEEEKRIVDNLSKVEKVLDIKNKQIEELQNFIKSQFVEMFENNKFEKKNLRDVAIKITDGSHNPPKGVDERTEYLMLSSQNIIEDRINYNNARYLSREDFEIENKRTYLEKGDVLLTIVGTIGRTAIIYNENNITLQRSVAVIKPIEEINSEYLAISLKSDDILKQLNKGSKGVAQKGIYLNDLKKILIPFPPITLQNQFSEIVKQIDKQKFEIEKSLKETQELYESLMEKYFG